MLLVRSYRTFAPLPPNTLRFSMLAFWCNLKSHISNLKSGGGIFLWHYPHDRSHWALPSKFGFSGARTFLRLAFANPQPPAPTFSPNLLYAIVRPSIWDFRFTILTCRALNFDIFVYSNSCAVGPKASQTILNFNANALKFTHGWIRKIKNLEFMMPGFMTRLQLGAGKLFP